MTRRGAMRACDAGRPARRGSPGVVLLEVLLAVTIFTIAAAVVGSSVRSALETATDLRDDVHAVNLAVTVLARLNTGELELIAVPATPFDEDDPTWTYEVAVEPITADEALQCVTVTVRQQEALRPQLCRLTQWMLVRGDEQVGDEQVGGEYEEGWP